MNVIYLILGLITAFIIPIGLLKLAIIYSNYQNKKNGGL